MKKIFYVIIVIIFIFGCKDIEKVDKKNNSKKNIVDEGKIEYEIVKEWKYGFALDKNGKPIYYDPDHFDYNGFYKFIGKEDSSDKEDEVIKDAFLQFSHTGIWASDAKRSKSTTIGFVRIYDKDSSRDYRHKIINNKNYISEDGENWEKIEILYLKETNEISPASSSAYKEPLVLVYFKCKFFEGEYYLVFHL